MFGTFVTSPVKVRFVLLSLFLVLLPVHAKEKKRDDRAVLQEEQQDYYGKWLKEDVVYIITDEELDVFNGLGTMEEKEQFIEQFWRRRDPDLRTAINEYKEEHYRRIAYANERFPSGMPGWRTDRGRIYIIHGPPDQITSRAGGGFYARPMHEGGGVTSTYPFETWRYRYIEGLGQEIELEFVDASLSGEYRLSLDHNEKDALLYMPGGGLTLAEEMGLAEKKDRPFFSPGMRDSFPYMATRAQDDVFERYERYVRIKAPKPIKYGDLKGLVDVSVGYESLPFRVRRDYFKLGDDRVVVPVTVELDNGELSFKLEKNQSYVAKVGVYGAVTSMTRQVVDEFDYDLVQTYLPEAYAAQAQKRGPVHLPEDPGPGPEAALPPGPGGQGSAQRQGGSQPNRHRASGLRRRESESEFPDPHRPGSAGGGRASGRDVHPGEREGSSGAGSQVHRLGAAGRLSSGLQRERRPGDDGALHPGQLSDFRGQGGPDGGGGRVGRVDPVLLRPAHGPGQAPSHPAAQAGPVPA